MDKIMGEGNPSVIYGLIIRQKSEKVLKLTVLLRWIIMAGLCNCMHMEKKLIGKIFTSTRDHFINP